MDKLSLKKLILKRLDEKIISNSDGNFSYWIINDLLPKEIAEDIASKFPEESILRKRDSLREYKRVGIDFDSYDPLMENITYVFHESEIVNKISKITGFKEMVPDYQLYAGGLSSMSKNSFLNPHLDNSHNDDGSMFRVLNLLYYVSKDWKFDYGGNLVLFPKGMDDKSITLHSKFNTLVLMETNNESYHGVSKVTNNLPRRCVSNYYFSNFSTNNSDYNHVTSFFSFKKDSKIKSFKLFLDRSVRKFLSKPIKSLIKHKNWHKRDLN